MLSKSDAAETGFQEPLKSQSEGKIYLSRFLRMPTLTSLIKRIIVKDNCQLHALVPQAKFDGDETES